MDNCIHTYDVTHYSKGERRERVLCDRVEQFITMTSPAGMPALPLEVTDEIIEQTKAIIASSPVRAAGYRIKVLLLEATKGLDAGEAAVMPTLAKAGFITKSDNQKAREDKGTDTALVVDIGCAAYNNKAHLGEKPWVEVGHIIKMVRYTGHAYEEPPGSGKRYAIINDEDVLGYYEQRVNA